MLQAIETFPDDMTRFDYWFQGYVAVDPETQAHLQATRGRSKAGRPHKYWVAAPDGTTYASWAKAFVTAENPKGEYQKTSYSRVFTLTAYSDQEAIEKANKMFPKKFEKFKAMLEQTAQE